MKTTDKTTDCGCHSPLSSALDSNNSRDKQELDRNSPQLFSWSVFSQ